MAVHAKSKSKRRKPIDDPNDIMDTIYHSEKKICQIVATGPGAKMEAFAAMRPQPYTCADYSISQTDTKLDAGPTKIHICQTEATYEPLTEPPPPPKRKRPISYFSGGPPQWEFVDEIWRRQQEELQKIYHVQFAERVAKRKRSEKLKHDRNHRAVVQLVGPEWYQELSPKQIQTVDNLKSCIVKDLQTGSIIQTKENIAKLGLVLRPNPKHLAKALKECCECPVEFLLVLYQLINPKRTRYSINDRLLLSAVVHLTMRETLRELHVRIPSPPPPQKPVKKAPKKPMKIKYDSPYLEPYTFQPEPPKFTGVYVNKHVQIPDCPYFSYLHKVIGKINPKPELSEDREIAEELQVAQSLYEELADYRPVRSLLKPSKYPPCMNFLYKPPEPPIEIPQEELTENLIYVVDENLCPCENCAEDHGDSYVYLISGMKQEENGEVTPIIGGVIVKKSLKCRDRSECPPQNTSCWTEPSIETVMCDQSCGEPSTTCSEPLPLEDCANMDLKNKRVQPCRRCRLRSRKCIEKAPCPCAKCTEDRTRRGVNYIVSGLKETASGSVVPVISGIIPKKSCSCLAAYEAHLDELEGNIPFVKGPDISEPKLTSRNHQLEENTRVCKRCRGKSQKLIDKPPCNCVKCEEDRKRRGIDLIIAGMKETDSGGALPIIAGVVEKKPCTCMEEYQQRVRDYELDIPCDCKKEIEKISGKPLCPCDRCEEDRRRRSVQYLVSGLRETESGTKVPVMGGIVMKRPCKCLQQYQEKMRQYEAYIKRQEAVLKLKEQENRFIIGGVVNTPTGPVYQISGLQPQLKCKCAAKADEEAKEQRRLANMPRIPPGRIKYAIGGVKETPEGNVYILNQTLPTKDCSCMEIYKKFNKQHSTCLSLYEDYLEKMKSDIDEYMGDLRSNSTETGGSTETNLDLNVFEANLDAINEEANRIKEILTDGEDENVQITEVEEKLPDVDVIDEDSCSSEGICPLRPPPPKPVEKEPEEQQPKCCKKSCGPKKPSKCRKCKKSPKTKGDCSCASPPAEAKECTDCTCGAPPIVEEVIEEVVEEPPPPPPPPKPLKRLFIFKKIKCDLKWQMNLLKKALATMADDGFPLAKLPDCHKLPHFKLWMELRCGRFWTLADRYTYSTKSKIMWRHTDICYKHIFTPKLSIDKSKAAQLTWIDAKYVKKMASDAVSMYYRKVRQAYVNMGRELFPTMFAYEFPFSTFRDCYFSYVSTKEEEVLAPFVWAPFEVKNFSKRKSCLC